MRRLLPLLALLACACVSRRVLVLENRVLLQDNEDLREEVASLRARLPPPEDYVRHPDLGTAAQFLDRAGYRSDWEEGDKVVTVPFEGRNARFLVTIQYFESAGVYFIATDDYLKLEQASNTESVVLLLTQIATLNYEVLLGKFQVNPRSGEVVVSVEIDAHDGLGFETFLHVFERLLATADVNYPQLESAAGGLGL